MKKIKLTKNKYALVDDEDFDYLNQWSWHLDIGGYATSWEKGKTHKTRKHLFIHRLVAKTPQGMFTDHINGDRLDNRRSNLRVCTYSQNRYNTFKTKGRYISDYKGISRELTSKSWRVGIMVNKKQEVIYGFKNERHAALAYDLWAKDLYGDYAKLNFKHV